MVKMPIMARKENNMKKLYFVCGSQDLYGEEVLKQVAIDAKDMADYLNSKISGVDVCYIKRKTL